MANQKTSDAAILKKLAQLANQNDPINPDLYAKYDVKRGLRNSNGTGVLVGLTHIGDVVGYKIEDGNKIPVPGRLIYRGYDVEDLIADSERNNQFGFEQCIYLLLFGQLPNQKQLESFNNYLGSCRVLPENFTEDMIMGYLKRKYDYWEPDENTNYLNPFLKNIDGKWVNIKLKNNKEYQEYLDSNK